MQSHRESYLEQVAEFYEWYSSGEQSAYWGTYSIDLTANIAYLVLGNMLEAFTGGACSGIITMALFATYSFWLHDGIMDLASKYEIKKIKKIR